VSATEPILITVPKRDLIDLYSALLEVLEQLDETRRLRQNVNAARIKVEGILSRVAPGLILEVSLAREVTPAEVPKPAR
jgi:hypothetical protein